ncbi:MAG: alpha/beta hydrolase [Acidocella sp. 20-63-7]|nr:MAG: alpha/beta hydrolase [Acidocella sp. 20-63-7]HQT46910.1 alpha/beta hydrolase [Acidocella sp.]
MAGLSAYWGLLSQEEREIAYNNNAAVAEAGALIEERNAASHVFRAAFGATLDLPYGPLPRNQWDLYPAADAQAPCLVFIHGGYWLRNRREDFACLAEGLRAHGWSVAMPGYTLAPDIGVSGIVRELDAALTWLAANGGQFGIAGKIILSGWSAGGHLATMLLEHPAVAAGLAISGVFELGMLRDTSLNKTLQLTDEEVALCSPLRLPAVHKTLAIAYGSRELPALVADSRNLHAHRAAQHAPGALLPIPEANHFSILRALRDPQGELVRLALGLV